MLLASAIFAVTLALVLWQPKGIGIGWSALAGAAAALATGIVQWSDVAVVWGIVWDATFTFVALIVISLILDAAGVFSWAALHVAQWGRGRGRVLFPLVIALGAVISAFFANDGAALILTPIVIAVLARLSFPPGAILAFVVATGFVADSTSLPLVISNLVNIVTANYFELGFGRYAAVMVPVDLISLAATLAVLWALFGRRIPLRYALEELQEPRGAVKDGLVFAFTFPLLAVLLAAYFLTAPLGVPVSVVTGGAALALMVVAGRWWRAGRGAVVSVTAALRGAPWQIVLFSVGMYVVVYGLGQAGLTGAAVRVLSWLAAQGELVATVGTGFVVAVVASIMNNMPSTLIAALAIDQAQLEGVKRELMIYASVIGNDLGPKFTPVGSLATLLWLHVLAGKGHRIGWGQYMRIGLLVTPPVLLAALLALRFWLPLVAR